MIYQELVDLLGQDACSEDPADQLVYGYDHSAIVGKADIITFPSTTEQVAGIVKIANKYKIPIITRGTATNTCGASVPINGGIILSTQKLNQIIQINSHDRYAVVQPGVINGMLQNELAKSNMFWPPDPSSAKICTIGGNIACNAAGPSAVKYGVTRDHVLGLTFVTGNAEIIKSGVCTTKGVVGYDLTRLLIGSQGTLGIITEAILKISPLPKHTHTMRATYRSIQAATEVITNLMQQSVIPSALEILDASCLKLIKSNSHLNIPAQSQALLIIEANGSSNTIDHDSTLLFDVLRNHTDCLDSHKATCNAERNQLWQARKQLSPKLKRIAPFKINEDVVVPVSQLPEFITFIENLAQEYQLPIVNFGHAGNGNIHVNLLINDQDLIQKKNADICLEKIFAKVLALKGTLSGEHGIGLTKAPFLKLELNEATLQLNKNLKRVFDSNNLLNPQLVEI